MPSITKSELPTSPDTPQSYTSVNLSFWGWFIESFDKLVLVLLVCVFIGVSVFSAFKTSNALFELAKDQLIMILGALIGIIKGRGESTMSTKTNPPINQPNNQ